MSGRQLDTDQRAVVESPTDEPLIVVAGAGTGKTTAITARALKMVFVEKRDPGSIVLTTFTKKAAKEIRSRVLGWGFQIKEVLLSTPQSQTDQDYLTALDINRFVTGTLDSLAEQIMGEYRSPGSAPSVVLDEFIADSVLLREGLFPNFVWQDADSLSWGFRLDRSLRFVNVDVQDQNTALAQFDGIVSEIEASVNQETTSGSIVNSWPTRPVRDTCVACDFRTMCPDSLYRGPAVTPLGRPESQPEADEE